MTGDLSAKGWKCAGCGLVSPDGNKPCECVTICAYHPTELGSRWWDDCNPHEDAKDGVIASLRTALATEREAREKAEKETAEARAEVARYWTSADMKPWVDLAEAKGLGHFGKKLKGMFSRALKAEDDARLEFERAESAEASLAEAKRLLKAALYHAETEGDDTLVTVARRFLSQEAER